MVSLMQNLNAFFQSDAFVNFYQKVSVIGFWVFDYLDYGVSVRLISNLKKILADGGILAISDVRDKFSNPSIYFMEWVGDWSLIYRGDDEFRNIFLDAGFLKKDLSCSYEQQGVMQYALATNGARRRIRNRNL